jgi:hypothetical protein
MESHALPKVGLTAARCNAVLAQEVLDEYSATGMSLTAFAHT